MTTGGPGPTTRSGRRCRVASRLIAASSTTSKRWSWTRAPFRNTFPIWVGGRTLRSLRRAVSLADGWCPFAVPPAQAAEWLAQVEVPPGFEVVLPPAGKLAPIDEPAQTQDVLAQTKLHGATIVSCGFRHQSLCEYLDKLQARAEVHSAMGIP